MPASPITIVENEFITVHFFPDTKIIQHTIHKPIADQAFKDALNAGTEVLKQYGVRKWLSDDRKNGPLSQDVIDWGFKDWEPRTIAAGWEYWANIVPEEAAAASTLTDVIHGLAEMGLRMRVFSDVKKATEWLNSLSE